MGERRGHGLRSRFGIAVACGALAALAGAAPAAADWPVYGHDLANSRNAGTSGPAAQEIPAMKQAWKFDSPTGDFTGTPVIAAGVLVAGDYSGTVYALDAKTGKVRWTAKLGDPVTASAAIDPSRGAVYVPVAKVGAPRVVALSLKTGKLRWSAVLTKQETASAYGSPTYWNGSVYMGTSGPNGDNSTARGAVVALDAATGNVRWRTFTVPSGHDGGPVWSTPAIDTKAGRLYVGTGNAYHGEAADTTDSILALDAATGAIQGHYQAIPQDTFGGDSAAGPDADFGASPNLIQTPDGKQLVGEGAKDGNYYAVDRSTMKFAWKTSIGPGSPAGGFVGSTAYDGNQVYGANALTSQVGAIRSNGSSAWTDEDGGSPEFSPVATAHGLLYTLSPSGNVTIREVKTGTVLRSISVGAPTFGGISTTGGAVYVAVGLGPPPAPAPQQYGKGSIVAFGDTSRSGAGGNGGGGKGHGNGQKAKLRVKIRPKRVIVGHRVRFRFRVTDVAGVPVRHARIRFAGRSRRTGHRGRASIKVRFKHPGKRRVRVTAGGYRTRKTSVKVRR